MADNPDTQWMPVRQYTYARGHLTYTSVSGDRSRHDRLDRHPTPGPRSSLWQWPASKHPLRVAVNYIVIVLCRVLPSLRVKNWLYRRLGMTVGPGVGVGLEATPDVFFPEKLTIEADAIIGYDATLLAHEYLQEEYRVGPVRIEEQATVGAGAIVLPGVTVGAGATVAANSLVVADVPAETTVAGVPAEPVDGPMTAE